MTQNKSYETAGIDSLEVGGNSPIGGMFTSAIASGKALADDGELYDSVQTAVDNATGIVFVGEGTFNENVTISTAGLTLQGSGYDTLIDGGTTGYAVSVSAKNVVVSNVSVKTDPNGITVINPSANNIKFNSVNIREGGSDGINLFGADFCTVKNCRISSCSVGIDGDETSKSIITNNTITDVSGIAILLGDDAHGDNIVARNIIVNPSNHGIGVSNNDNIIIGNRIQNAVNNGLADFGGFDDIYANNRISDSGSSDIDTVSASGEVLDDNKTGPSN